MPDRQKTHLGTFRVEESLWQAAQAEAARRGETVSEAVRRMLRRYTQTRKEET